MELDTNVDRKPNIQTRLNPGRKICLLDSGESIYRHFLIVRYLLHRHFGPASLLRADGRYVYQRVRRDHAVSRELWIGFSQATVTFGNVGI